MPIVNATSEIAGVFERAGFRLYLVGGAVRDTFIDEASTPMANGETQVASDLDCTTDATPDEIEQVLRGWADAVWLQGKAYGTVGCRKGGQVYEITTHRGEHYHGSSRNPEVSFGLSIEEDLRRRDFTINAMALRVHGMSAGEKTSASRERPVQGERPVRGESPVARLGGSDETGPEPALIDPFHGLDDLVARRLRTPMDATTAFADDPLRMLRAARFISRFHLEPDEDLIRAVEAEHHRLAIVSPERIRDELDRLLVTADPTPGLWFMVRTGLAGEFLPELPALALEQDPIHRHKDVLAHTIAVVAKTTPDRLLRLAALFHDVGKPRTRTFGPEGVQFHQHDVVGARMTRSRMRALHYPNADIDAVSRLVELHLRFHTYRMGWTDHAVRRYVRDAGPLLGRLNELTRCDCTTRNEGRAKALARRIDELERRIAELEKQEALDAIRPELDGQEVMAHLGLQPGPEVGEALRFLLELRMEEGLIGKEETMVRLDRWWQSRSANPL